MCGKRKRSGLDPRAAPAVKDRPYLPRFLLLEIIFVYCPYDGDEPTQPRLQGSLSCRTDWLDLREIAKIRMGDLTHPRNRRLSVVQFVRTSRLR